MNPPLAVGDVEVRQRDGSIGRDEGDSRHGEGNQALPAEGKDGQLGDDPLAEVVSLSWVEKMSLNFLSQRKGPSLLGSNLRWQHGTIKKVDF